MPAPGGPSGGAGGAAFARSSARDIEAVDSGRGLPPQPDEWDEVDRLFRGRD